MKSQIKRLQVVSRCSGFTLVELLIVIVIIAVLVGIGAPLANKMRARADESLCVGNMKNWGNAISLYMADSGGVIECRNWNSIGSNPESAYVTYLTGEESHKSGYQELAKMRCCPALKGKDAISGNGNSLTAYAFTDASGVASSNQKVAAYPLAKIQDPSRFVMMIEVANVRTPATIKTKADYSTMVRPLTNDKKRHKDGAVNVLMGDFSIKTVTWKDISKNISRWTDF